MASPSSPWPAQPTPLDSALRSAIADVEQALPGVHVLRAEVDRADVDAPTAV
jgi:hypothetical protein